MVSLLALSKEMVLSEVIIILPFTILIISFFDIFQKTSTIRRNFPFIGHFRYFFEFIRPEIQQYFIESDTDGKPISRIYRSLVYQRAKGVSDYVPFGTQLDVYSEEYEWVPHSLFPTKIESSDLKVEIGDGINSFIYRASLFNISAMSFGSISPSAIKALGFGAHKGNFFLNTGEGGVSKYHLESNADLVWQIGTGYFGCRNKDGSFNLNQFKSTAALSNVKMIEIKLSQGAKPGHGGMLPSSKVNSEIAEARGVDIGIDVHSPPSHSAFGNFGEMLMFLNLLRKESGKKPTGFKLCIGKKAEFVELVKAMISLDIFPDFLTIDGGEGGTGAAPLELSNRVGMPLNDALEFVNLTLKHNNVRSKIKIIASGKILTAFDVIKKISLGADLVNSARGMMLALGCIQALRCHTNNCPAGITTNKKSLYSGLDATDKGLRVFNYHDKTLKSVAQIIQAMGLKSITEVDIKSIESRL